jgi:putative acetyltransferase
MILRPANAADAQAILHVHTESLTVLCAGDYTPEQIAGWAALPVDERWLPRKFAAGDVVLVAEDAAGTVIGFGERAGEEIRAIYVHPLHARRGVGRMLLRELERSAVAVGIQKLRLDSSVTAEGFYKRCGFAVDSRCMHDCGNGTRLECVRMLKPLQTPDAARE